MVPEASGSGIRHVTVMRLDRGEQLSRAVRCIQSVRSASPQGATMAQQHSHPLNHATGTALGGPGWRLQLPPSRASTSAASAALNAT